MMEGSKGGVRVGVTVGVGVGDDDMGDGMQCSNHPYRNNPAGICAFCLQEKLGKLVSSSFPLPICASPSSSSPPPFRSETGGNGGSLGGGATCTTSLSVVRHMSTRNDNGNTNGSHYEECYTRKARIPFLLAKKKTVVASSDHTYHHRHHHGANIAFKRSKSTAAPIRGRLLDGDNGGDFSSRKRTGFWSFLYLSSKTHGSKKQDKVASVAPPPDTVSTVVTDAAGGASSSSIVNPPKEKNIGYSRKGSVVVIEDDDSPTNEATPSAGSSFERKVSRSRSVGCGSRSFSGDFFERISTGFGDCTLRRVESQREGKSKTSTTTAAVGASSAMKERVKCGGLFGGFIITSSSSSSSSSYWLSSSTEDQNVNRRSTKSWGWAFASPMRAFVSPSSGKKKNTIVIRELNNKNATPNLSDIPSLLAVRS